MITDTPIWLMDVDGVLNAFDTPSMFPELRHFRSANGYDIVYNPSILQRIAELHTSGRVEVRWLTTWEELADEYLAETLGMPRGLKVQGVRNDYPRHVWWKLNEAQGLVNEGERVVWTDDELLSHPDSVEWLKMVPATQLMAHAPDTTTGITHEFLDEVEAWL